MKKAIVMILVIAMALSCLFAGGSQEKKATQFYSYASFNTGTFQYMYAAAFAGELLKIHPEYNVTAEATSSTSENLDLTYRGEAVFASASPEKLYNAYNALDKYAEKGPLNAGIMWCYQNQVTLLFTKANSGIKGFGDLKGKKVCIGAAGSSNETKNSFVLDAYGYHRPSTDVYEYSDLKTVSIDYNEGASALADGSIDAIIATQPLPEPTLYELALTNNIAIYAIDAEKVPAIRSQYAWMWDSTVPADSYPNQKKALDTLGDPNYVIASLDGLSEEDAYIITKAYVEQILPVLATQFDVCKPFAADPSLLTANWVIPGHPGAVKYYTEKGYKCEVIKP